MKRRHALLTAVLTLAYLSPLRVMAQPTAKAPVIGLLDAGERPGRVDAFLQRMRDLGYVDGRNVTFVQRYAKGNVDATGMLARELVEQKVTVIVTSGAAAALASQRATNTIPIVMPAISGSTEYVEVGGLISYGPSYPDLARHAALYVDKILKGANPGDLPIELPTTFELAYQCENGARARGGRSRHDVGSCRPHRATVSLTVRRPRRGIGLDP